MSDILIIDPEAEFYRRAVAAQFPDLDVAAAPDPAAAAQALPEARVLVGLAPVIARALPAEAATPRLEWVQALSAGVDSLHDRPALRGAALTSCAGIHGPQMAEMAILLMMAGPRRLVQMIDNHRAGHWERWKQPILKGRTVCILGLGAIAETLVGVCNALGMRVTGISDGRREMSGVTRIWPRKELLAAASDADFLVVLVPLSPETRHIVDAAVLDALGPEGWLISMARGGCVDEDALIAALRERRIAGAGLDVFATEPLPADSPLRTLPNVVATPHVGGFSTCYHEQALPVVLRNIADWQRGGVAALRGRVDRA